jgi:hypothetical protein
MLKELERYSPGEISGHHYTHSLTHLLMSSMQHLGPLSLTRHFNRNFHFGKISLEREKRGSRKRGEREER